MKLLNVNSSLDFVTSTSVDLWVVSATSMETHSKNKKRGKKRYL